MAFLVAATIFMAVNGSMLAGPPLGIGQVPGQAPNITIREINASHADFVLENVDLRCVDG